MWIASLAYKGFVHLAFKIESLVADSSEEAYYNSITLNSLHYSLDKLVANFIGFDEDVNDVPVLTGHTSHRNSLEIALASVILVEG